MADCGGDELAGQQRVQGKAGDCSGKLVAESVPPASRSESASAVWDRIANGEDGNGFKRTNDDILRALKLIAEEGIVDSVIRYHYAQAFKKYRPDLEFKK